MALPCLTPASDRSARERVPSHRRCASGATIGTEATADFHQGAQLPCCNPDAVYRAAAEIMPALTETLLPRGSHPYMVRGPCRTGRSGRAWLKRLRGRGRDVRPGGAARCRWCGYRVHGDRPRSGHGRWRRADASCRRRRSPLSGYRFAMPCRAADRDDVGTGLDPVAGGQSFDLFAGHGRNCQRRSKSRPRGGVKPGQGLGAERHGARAHQIAGACHGALARRANPATVDQVVA